MSLHRCSLPGSPVRNNSTGLVEFHMEGPLRYMMWYHAVGLVWISEFILACQQMTIAGAVVTYYYTRSVCVCVITVYKRLFRRLLLLWLRVTVVLELISAIKG